MLNKFIGIGKDLLSHNTESGAGRFSQTCVQWQRELEKQDLDYARRYSGSRQSRIDRADSRLVWN